MDAGKANQLLDRLNGILDRLESGLLPDTDAPRLIPDSLACRWVTSGTGGKLVAIPYPTAQPMECLLGIDEQKSELIRNTEQFLSGKPANNVLLWGSRGTGKSSLIKALLPAYSDKGLRMIEVERSHLYSLPEIVEPLRNRAERFVIYSDDLSFEANDPGYKALKATLDGSLATPPENVLIYATSNRRHLLPEYLQENQESKFVGGEIHHGEAVEEKISLSERFGLWLAFHPFSQEQYLQIVDSYLESFGLQALDNQSRPEALRWALKRGSRSGRVAWQFARDWAGRQ